MSRWFAEIEIESSSNGLCIRGSADGSIKYSLSRYLEESDWVVSCATMPSGTLEQSILIANLTLACQLVLSKYPIEPGWFRRFETLAELKYFILHSEVFGPQAS